MKIYYDQKVDAAYLQLSEETPTVVVEISVSDGVNLDLTRRKHEWEACAPVP
jgi:uncharacterized protein YuzE